MRWRSFRVRLTLWNAAILTLVLTIFGVTLAYSVQVSMLRAVEAELAAQVRRFTSDRPPRGRGPFPPGPPGEEMRGGPPDGAPRDDRFRDGPFGGGLPADGPFRDRILRGGGPPAEPQPSAFPELDRLEAEERARMAIRRPRLLNRQGEPLRAWEETGPWDPETFQASLRGEARYSTIRADGQNLRVLSVPWRREGEIQGVVQIARDLREYERLRGRQLRIFLLLLPLALIAAVAGGYFLTDRALRPVRDVTHAADEIGAEDLSRRLGVTGDDELAELASTFNRMIARLEEAFGSREEAYRRLSAAYEQQRRFTSDASHELRTPLARIKGSTSLALSLPRTAEEYVKALRTADQAADVMTRLIQDLLLLARSDAGRLELPLQPADLRTVLREALSHLPEATTARVQLRLPDQPLPVRADPAHLARVFVNLLENAVRHMPPEGEVTLAARAEGGFVIAEVADQGEGIPAEHLPHLFERFYRVEAARSRQGGGAGLGLAISKSIVEAHGGEITVASEAGRGTTFTVRMPLEAA